MNLSVANMITIAFVIIILTIVPLQCQITGSTSPCDAIYDCFNCTMFSRLGVNCQWSAYKCEQVDKVE